MGPISGKIDKKHISHQVTGIKQPYAMTEPFVLSLSRGTMRFFSTFRFSAFCKQPYGWGVLLVVFWAFQKKRQSFVVAMPFPLYEKALSYMRLFHLHSTVKIQPFSPAFPSAESAAKAFGRLFLWDFKEKASTIFYNTSHSPFRWFLKNSFWISHSWNTSFIAKMNISMRQPKKKESVLGCRPRARLAKGIR